ncbi:YIPF5-like protein [Drosera capensis]
MSQIPPVIFPSGAAAISTNNPTPPPNHQRRHQPHPHFTPLPTNPNVSTTTSIPFISFDAAAAAGTTTTTTPFPHSSPPPSLGSGGSLNFDAEPPLLEELGINTKQIWSKTVSILNPFKIRVSGHEDADLSGPFVVLLGFGLFQLLAGKFHFGVLLGWVTVAAVWLHGAVCAQGWGCCLGAGGAGCGLVDEGLYEADGRGVGDRRGASGFDRVRVFLDLCFVLAADHILMMGLGLWMEIVCQDSAWDWMFPSRWKYRMERSRMKINGSKKSELHALFPCFGVAVNMMRDLIAFAMSDSCNGVEFVLTTELTS